MQPVLVRTTNFYFVNVVNIKCRFAETTRGARNAPATSRGSNADGVVRVREPQVLSSASCAPCDASGLLKDASPAFSLRVTAGASAETHHAEMTTADASQALPSIHDSDSFNGPSDGAVNRFHPVAGLEAASAVDNTKIAPVTTIAILPSVSVDATRSVTAKDVESIQVAVQSSQQNRPAVVGEAYPAFAAAASDFSSAATTTALLAQAGSEG